jgi:hypothetical protein
MPRQKRKVRLLFPDLKSLLDFTLEIEITKCEIIKSQFILICELEEAKIELAINGFGAKEENIE